MNALIVNILNNIMLLEMVSWFLFFVGNADFVARLIHIIWIYVKNLN